MLRRILFCFILILCSLQMNLMAQGGLWAHMHGSIGSGAMGQYGTLGVANANNTPSGRYQGAFWTDKQGNFWMFGGFGPWGYYNDLWKLDPITVQWTWIKGPQTITDQNGEFGIKGVPSPLNYPSARTFGPNCWTDNNGDLWMYGGHGFDVNGTQGGLQDLWRYNIANNEWTWMGGSNVANIAPVHGTIGVASPTNNPGAREECKSAWVDDNNNLWMFGGQDGATANVSSNVRNDMWKYNISTGEWTWMKGASTMNSNGSYGTKGVEAPTNNPPARFTYTRWKGKDKNFYVFAGGNSATSRNDVWRYNINTNNWTWISGASQQNNAGNYTAQCQPEELHYPSARMENQTVATSTCTEIFWSFGGFKTVGNPLSYNDLWLYNLTTNKWTWVSGSQATNINPNPGPIGVAQPGRYIGSKGGVAIWTDAQNNLWIFGGLAHDSTLPPPAGQTLALGLKNDLWRFQPDSTCFDASFFSTLALEYPGDSTFCPGDTTSIPVPVNTAITIDPNTDWQYNTDSSRIIFSPTTTTTYTVYGAESGLCVGRDTISFTIVVEPFPIAAFTASPLVSLKTEPLITLTNTSQFAASYEWYFNNLVFATSTDATYNGTDSGEYCFTLIAYNNFGCSDTAVHCVNKLEPDNIFVPSVFSPNDDTKNDVFRIIGSNITLKTFVIYDRWGEEVFSTKNLKEGWDGTFKGKKAEVGTYYYYIEYDSFKGKKTLKGDINLVR